MKIRVEVDLTPQELRQFYGFPDVEPLNTELMEQMRRNMQAGAEGFDPASLLRPMMPLSLQTMEAMQRAFWEALSTSSRREKSASEDS